MKSAQGVIRGLRWNLNPRLQSLISTVVLHRGSSGKTDGVESTNQGCNMSGITLNM